MKDDNTFESFLQNKLSEAQYTFQENDWDLAQARFIALANLEKKKKRRKFFWLIFSGLVIGFGFMYWSLGSLTNNPINNMNSDQSSGNNSGQPVMKNKESDVNSKSEDEKMVRTIDNSLIDHTGTEFSNENEVKNKLEYRPSINRLAESSLSRVDRKLNLEIEESLISTHSINPKLKANSGAHFGSFIQPSNIGVDETIDKINVSNSGNEANIDSLSIKQITIADIFGVELRALEWDRSITPKSLSTNLSNEDDRSIGFSVVLENGIGNILSNNKTEYGSAGVSFVTDLRMGQNIYLTTGLGYNIAYGRLAKSITEQNTFDFIATTTIYEWQLEEIQSLHIPLQLSYQKTESSHRFSIGIMTYLRINTSGNLEITENFSSNEVGNIFSEKGVDYGESIAFFNIQGAFAYMYNINGHMSLGYQYRRSLISYFDKVFFEQGTTSAIDYNSIVLKYNF